MRRIKIRWNDQRNIRRVNRWLNLQSDFCGFLYRRGALVGYKTNSTSHIIFNFFWE